MFQKKYHLPEDKIVMPSARKWASSKVKNKELIFSWDGQNRDWVSKHGLRSYKDFLIKHPGYVLGKWIQNWQFYNIGIWKYSNRKIAKKLNHFMFHFPGSIPFFLALIIFIFGVVFVKENPLILFTVSHAFIVGMITWHGDAMEVIRHFIPVSFTLRIAFLIFLVQIYSFIRQKLRSG